VLGLGVGMLISGLIAWVIAVTRVVLPYDEAFLGTTRSGIDSINPHLLHFMTHDRVTLAGTMISLGVLYTGLAWNGIRFGAHWAWRSAAASAIVGFLSFFLFLGFGYFDPLHALAAVLLFIIFAPALVWARSLPHGGVGRIAVPPDCGTTNDIQWRRGLVGQLIFVSIGLGLVGAGCAIAAIGVTRVFVPTDLMFLMTTRDAITGANPHLLPLIAHDRAGFGGALVSDGVAVLTLSLWGFRPGASWVWWTLLLAGLPGFLAAVWVHVHIGYMNMTHLFPAYLAIALFAAGLALSRRMLCVPSRSRT